jgi:phosphohistidine phosphatase
LELYLVRHAIAETRDAGRWPDDADRPLTDDGAARFGRAARGLRGIAPEVEAVLSSPAARAWQTAEILRRAAGWPAPERADELAADRALDGALAALAARREPRSIAIVGHEPLLSMLASLLLVGDAVACRLELKKGGVVLLAFAGEPARGGALLRWSASPKMLRALAR